MPSTSVTFAHSMADFKGPPLEVSLDRLTNRSDPIASIQDVLSALQRLQSNGHVSISSLERILCITKYPLYFSDLCSSSIIPACMKLIRSCQRKSEVSCLPLQRNSTKPNQWVCSCLHIPTALHLFGSCY
jgi:hypothetical protein